VDEGGSPHRATAAAVVATIGATAVGKPRPKIHAVAKVPEYSVIDVHACTVLRMTKPRKGAYSRTTKELGKADTVKLVAFPDVVVKLKDVLP
jgi:hypothetical protein